MAIYNFMDISTGHLTDGDVELLNQEELPFNVMTYEYGWIVSTTSLMSVESADESIKEMSAAGLSKEFIEAARTAGDCQEFCAGGHDDGKERTIAWLSTKSFWTSFWRDATLRTFLPVTGFSTI